MYLLVTLGLALVRVAFFTLLERKVLSLSQLRVGPQKVGFLGSFQPFADAVKLWGNESFSLIQSHKVMFILIPGVTFFVYLCLWNLPQLTTYLNIKYRMLWLIILTSFSVLLIYVTGFCRNRLYALIGGQRVAAQAVSYEISLVLILIPIISLNRNFMCMSSYIIGCLSLVMLVLWVITLFAERNRAPFDFAEGERELVSGFNIEFGSGGFGLLFLSEISSILLICIVRGLFFFRVSFGMIISFVLVYLFLIVRSRYPRSRYDFIINLFWRFALPFTLIRVLILLL